MLRARGDMSEVRLSDNDGNWALRTLPVRGLLHDQRDRGRTLQVVVRGGADYHAIGAGWSRAAPARRRTRRGWRRRRAPTTPTTARDQNEQKREYDCAEDPPASPGAPA